MREHDDNTLWSVNDNWVYVALLLPCHSPYNDYIKLLCDILWYPLKRAYKDQYTFDSSRGGHL